MDREQAPRPILIIGRIGRAHALNGEVRVEPLTSDPDRFIGLEECLLLSADEKHHQPVRVASTRIAGGQVFLRLLDCDDRDHADKLRGRLLAVAREQAVKLPPDTWFICDLVGCGVYDEREGYLGILTDVIQNLAQDVYTVGLPEQPDLLFPAKKEFIIQVDLEARRIDVRLPDGLFDIYRKRSN